MSIAALLDRRRADDRLRTTRVAFDAYAEAVNKLDATAKRAFEDTLGTKSASVMSAVAAVTGSAPHSMVRGASNDTAVAPTAAAGGLRDKVAAVSDAFTAVSDYVPTEIITVYTLVIGTVVGNNDGDRLSMEGLLAFVVATPIVAWLVWAGKEVATSGATNLKQPMLWPWWSMLSAVIAFTAWSAMMPKSALTQWWTPSVWAIVLVVVSVGLPLVGKIIVPPRVGVTVPR